MSELTGITRPELINISTNFSIGSGMSTIAIDVGKYKEVSGFFKSDGGAVTIDFRHSNTTDFTIAASFQVTGITSVTGVFTLAPLLGRYLNATVSGIVSASAVEVHGYGIQA